MTKAIRILSLKSLPIATPANTDGKKRVGGNPNDAPSSSRQRRDSSGGDEAGDEAGDESPTESASVVLANARALLGSDTILDVEKLREAQREISSLLNRYGERELSFLTDQLRQMLARLVNAEVEIDAEATQVPDALQPQESQQSQGDEQVEESQLFSQLAEDIEELEDEELVARGDATQIEEMEVDAVAPRAAKRLGELRDAVVSLLRDVPVDGGVSAELRTRAEDLRRQLKPFQSSNEAARRMLAAIGTVLAQPVADAERSREGSTPAVAPAPPDDEEEAERPRIVGRATDVLANGTRRQSFLLYQPATRVQYVWLSEAGMRANSDLSAILDAYDGVKGDDPNGNGFVTAVLAARGPPGRRQYRVLWTVEPMVPLRIAQDLPNWMLLSQLVSGAHAMAAAFERGEDDNSDDSEDDLAPVADLESQSQQNPQGDGAATPRGSALQWDAGSSRPRLSLRRAIASFAAGHDWTVQALIEYTLTRMWALRCRAPPAPGQAGAPFPPQLDQLGKDMFTINETSLIASFKRERVQARRDAALEAAAAGDDDGEEDEDEDEEEDDEDALLAAWRAEREVELRDEALARWAQTRRDTAADLSTLQSQLTGLKAIEAAGGTIDNVDVTALRNADGETVANLVLEWQASPGDWPSQLARPRLKLPKIRDFLSTPGRSAQVRGWLKLQRDLHSAATAEQRRSGVFGSAYGPSWPTRPSATSCPADHVCPVRWLEAGTRLLIECGDPSQLPAVVISRLEENSAKSDDALALFSATGEAARAGQGIYAPSNVSVPKKAMLAKMVAWVWLLYPLISDKKRSAGIGAYARSTGCAWLGRAWESGPFRELVKATATPFEQRIQLLALAMPRWQVGNPLVFQPALLDADLDRMLLDRFKGTDGLPHVVDEALQAGVAAAPR